MDMMRTKWKTFAYELTINAKLGKSPRDRLSFRFQYFVAIFFARRGEQ
jgi:hypothetical protein